MAMMASGVIWGFMSRTKWKILVTKW
jgi:hypothetical protein